MQLTEPTRLTDQSRQLADRGYTVIVGLLKPAELAVMRQHVDAAVRRPPVAGCERPHNQLVPLRWSDPVVDLILASSYRCRRIATAVGANDLRWISGYVSLKEACTPPLWWHQDWWCWDHPVSLRPEAPQVALMCYLNETTESNGALRVLPGSHRRSVSLHAALPGAHARASALGQDDVAMSDQPGQVTLSVQAGDAVVLDYRLLHGTHANVSADRRDCVLLSFAPSWRELPTDLRAHLIQHLAQPTPDEHPVLTPWHEELLPSFDGRRADLDLNIAAPARFAVRG
jgi:hypothetical protein